MFSNFIVRTFTVLAREHNQSISQADFAGAHPLFACLWLENSHKMVKRNRGLRSYILSRVLAPPTSSRLLPGIVPIAVCLKSTKGEAAGWL